MRAKIPGTTGFGRCPSECPRFSTCFEVASSITALEFAVDADLAASPDADPTQTFAQIDDHLLMTSAAALAFPEPEPGCPRYIPPTAA